MNAQFLLYMKPCFMLHYSKYRIVEIKNTFIKNLTAISKKL